VEWAGKPQLDLGLTDCPFDGSDYILKICTSCNIKLTGDNTLGGIEINDGCNVTFIGGGTISVDDLTVNAGVIVKDGTKIVSKNSVTVEGNGKIELVDGTVKENGVAYSTATNPLYLAKSGSTYALCCDENGKFQYSAGKSTDWKVQDVNYAGGCFAILRLESELNKKVIFKQTATYVAALLANGADTKLGGFDASEGKLTVQGNPGDKKITISGDIVAQKLYMVDVGTLTVNIIDGSVKAFEKIGVDNEFIVGSADAGKKVMLSIQNGCIDFEKGTVLINGENTEVEIKENSANKAATYGINAHAIAVAKSSLKINDVDTGVKLYDPTSNDTGVAILSLTDGAIVSIDAEDVGVQGTIGKGYYNNITVTGDKSNFTISGGNKAVASVGIEPIPENKLVRSEDGKKVFFTINTDFTTDYCYEGTGEPVAKLTLKEITAKIDKAIQNGVITLSDQAAAANSTITIKAAPGKGYKLETVTVKDSKGGDVTVKSNYSFVLPDNNLPVTVSATFAEVRCSNWVESDLAGGEAFLSINGKIAGHYILAKSGNGWTIFDNGTDQFAAFDEKTRSLVWQDEAFIWINNGSTLFAQMKTRNMNRGWFGWWRPSVHITNYYLSANDAANLTVSTERSTVKIGEPATEHSYKYTAIDEDTHSAVCTLCGDKIEIEAHDYVDGVCTKCGRIAEDAAAVNVTCGVYYEPGYWFFWYNRGSYTAWVDAKGYGKDVTKIEISADGKNFRRGQYFTSHREITEFFARITTTRDGKTTTDTYKCFADGTSQKLLKTDSPE